MTDTRDTDIDELRFEELKPLVHRDARLPIMALIKRELGIQLNGFLAAKSEELELTESLTADEYADISLVLDKG